MAPELKTPAFEQGGTIPKKYTCGGDDISPALRWSGVPEGTRSLVLLCNDPDAPGGIFRHWAVYDIPPDRLGLDEGYGPETLRDGLKQAVNDFDKPGYGGPCPPEGHGAHHYHFRLMALSEPSLPLARTPAARRSRRRPNGMRSPRPSWSRFISAEPDRHANAAPARQGTALRNGR